MLRKRLVGALLAVTVVGANATVPRIARAQQVLDLDDDSDSTPAKKGAASKPGKKGTVDIDLDDSSDKGGGTAAAGQMTEQAAAAKRLFDKDRYAEAAVSLYRVVAGETGDDPGNQQLAQYYLAVSLYKLKFYQASYALFSLISMQKTHLKFRETLLWLAKLATQLPEPADIIERVGKYSDEEVARFDNPQQKDLFWQLNYMLGRYKYRNREYEDAIRLFQKVDEQSPYYVQSQFFSGISYVQLRKSVPAIKSFQRVEKAVDEGAQGVEDEGRMRDLAYLSMARTYYSSSIQLDPETNAPNVNSEKLSAAVKYWNQVDEASEYWLDALFEESWAYFMAGDYPRALGNIHTIQAPYFPGSFYPEADILKAVIYFSNCNYEAATTVVARFNKKYQPIRKELAKVLKHFSGEPEEAYKFLLAVRDGQADLGSEHQEHRPDGDERPPAAPQHRVREGARRRARALQGGPRPVPAVGSRATGSGCAEARSRDRGQERRQARQVPLRPEHGRPRRAPTERPEDSHRHHGRSEEFARREDAAGTGEQGRREDLRRGEARRRTHHLAVPG